MRVRIGIVAVVISLAATARSAPPDAGLEVERDSASEDCPDAAHLRTLAAKGRGALSASPTHAYRVSFARLGELYHVKVVDETAHRARRLQDAGGQCAPIGHAAALVLATSILHHDDDLPFYAVALIFASAFGTLALSFWPYMIPFAITIDQAAAPHSSLAFMFWGEGLFVFPLMLLYVAIGYRVFGGKVGSASMH